MSELVGRCVSEFTDRTTDRGNYRWNIYYAKGMNLDDLDLEDGLVRVRGKGKRERLAPLGEGTAWMAEEAGARQGPARKERLIGFNKRTVLENRKR